MRFTIWQNITRLVGRREVACLLLAVLCLIAFFPTFSNELMTGWDDQWQVVNAYTSGGWSWKNLSRIFMYSFHGQYSPLNQILYTFIYSCAEYNPAYYHAASLVIHLLNVCLVYILVRHIAASATRWPSARISWMAFGVALIFGIHPLQVESVAWMSASKILLSSFFYLLATYTFVRYLEQEKTRFYVWTILLFVCSYCSKEQAVIFPLWMLLLCYIYNVPFNKQGTWKAMAPFFLMAIVMGLVFALETRSTSIFEEGPPKDYTWWQRFVFSCYALVEYVCKFFIPYNLRYKYYFPMAPGEPLPSWLLMYPVLVAVPVMCFWRQIRQKPIFVSLMIFAIHILLVLHILPIGRQHIVADRYMYLSVTGLAMLTAILVFRIQINAKWRPFMCLLGCGIIVFCMYLTSHYTKLWRTTNDINKQTIETPINNNE